MRDRPDPSTETGTDDAPAACPYCGGRNTEQEHPKGPSLCRSMHYCHDCEEPFEAFA